MSAPGRDGAARRIGARACLGVAAVAGVFSFTVFLLLAASHTGSRRADPLATPALTELREQIRRSPEIPGLVEEYRRLDLLARRAYYDAVAFRHTGAWLLLGGLVITLTALKLGTLLVPRPLAVPAGGRAAPSDPAAAARWLVATAGVAAAGTLVFLAVRFPEQAPAPRVRNAADTAGRVVPAAPPQVAEVEEDLWDERLLNWPSFRGPDGGARAAGDSYPTDWDGATGRGVLWRTPLPRPGFSSPVVWGERIFVTGADEAAREVYALDARDGSLLWRHEVSGIPGSPAEPPEVTPDTGHAAPTAATDGRRVFAIFSTGDLVALDFAGKRLWAMNLGVPDNPYGHASSLLAWRDRLIVQYDDRVAPRVLALAAATGDVLWERFRDVDVSWSSPILAVRDGREELVLSGNPTVAGYDPATGDELWSLACMGGELASSPAFEGGTVFAANEYARLAAIELDGEARLAWEHGEGLPEVSSPLAIGGLLFMANGAGVVTALDTRDGAVRWQREFDEGFYASPVLAGGLVYLLDRAGVARIFEPAGEYREVAAPALGEPSSVTPAFAGGRVFLRGERDVVCVGASGGAGDSP